MRKLILLALLLSTPACADDDVTKLAQYGQCILKYGGACPKAAVGFPIPMPPVEYMKPYKGLLTVTKMDDYSVLRSLCNMQPLLPVAFIAALAV